MWRRVTSSQEDLTEALTDQIVGTLRETGQIAMLLEELENGLKEQVCSYKTCN